MGEHALSRFAAIAATVLFSMTRGQGAAIRGVVRDSASGEPLPGVTVRLLGGSRYAVTDARGGFALDAATGVKGARGRPASPPALWRWRPAAGDFIGDRDGDDGVVYALNGQVAEPMGGDGPHGAGHLARGGYVRGEAGEGGHRRSGTAAKVGAVPDTLLFTRPQYRSLSLAVSEGDTDLAVRLAFKRIAHGRQLTLDDVGPWSLQGVAKGAEVLVPLDPGDQRLSNWPGRGRPSWIPDIPYVYDSRPENPGGVVPAGGMTIDGYAVPAGTWVCQFRDFKAGVTIEGDCGGQAAAWPGVLFRGCRMRGNWKAPGWFNSNGISNGGIIWITYCDAGGTAYLPPGICESIFESKGYGRGRGAKSDRFYCIRNYLSIATTLAFGRNDGDAFIENYGREVCR